MYCKNCGKQIDDDAKFCVHCGSDVSQTISQEELQKQQAHEAWKKQMAQRLGQSAPETKNASTQSASRPQSKPVPKKENAASNNTTVTTHVVVESPTPVIKAKKPIFKRWWFWAIIVVVAISIISSGGNSENSQNYDQLSAGDTTPTEATLSIVESVLYEKDGIRITAKGIEDSFTGTCIKLLVENDTEKNIAVGCSDFVVNGITIHGYLHIDAAAGKKQTAN